MAQSLDVNTQSRIKSMVSNAKRLMALESNGTLDKIAKGVRDGIGNELLGNGNMDAASLMTTRVPKSATTPIPQSGKIVNKNIPSAILESFKKNPIDEAALLNSAGGSSNALDFLTEGIMNEDAPQPRQKAQSEDVRKLVSEGLTQTQPQAQYVQQVVDYPMIRTIVEDIVRKYAQSLNKKIINEGKDNGGMLNTLTIGKTFKFLDQKGNIFECQMKKIGNINDKKRGTIE